ncbi:MAG: carboxypeptidase-like regulatory domain-containing protein [Deltaproteobacteria bacterium]
MEGAQVCRIRAGDELAAECATTDRAGQFRFDAAECEPAPLLITSAPSYLPRSLELGPDACSLRSLTIRLSPGGVELQGRVLDAAGGYIAGALVSARAPLQKLPSTLVTTNADGRFVLSVPEGQLEAHASADGYSEASESVTGPYQDLILTLTPGGSVVGHVQSSSGAPLAHAHVVASNQDGLRVPERHTVSLSDGSFEFLRLPTGRYELWATGVDFRTRNQRVSVEMSAASSIWLTAQPAASLRGFIDVSGTPCRAGIASLSGPVAVTEEVGANGEVWFEGLPPGRYGASVVCSLERAGWEPDESAADIPSATLEDVVVLETGVAERRWSLTAPDSEPEPRGRGEIRAVLQWIGPHREPPTIFARKGHGRPVRGELRGELVLFADLPFGDYEVYPSGLPSASQLVGLSQPGQVAKLTFVLPASESISGRVVDASGAPIADAWISVGAAGPFIGHPLGQPVLSDSSGQFTVSALPRGDYDVSATAAQGEARAKNVAAGARQLELRIVEFGSMHGLVEGPRGEHPVSFLLSYRRSRDAQGGTIHGYHGTWSLPWLLPGDYELIARTAIGCGSARLTLDAGSDPDVKLHVGAANSSCTFAE